MADDRTGHPTVDERRDLGNEARKRTPPSSHAGWHPATGRADPVVLLEEQNVTREPAYRATLQDDRRRLLERFEIVDMARNVVGDIYLGWTKGLDISATITGASFGT